MITKMQMFGVFLTAATTGIPVALAVILADLLINTILIVYSRMANQWINCCWRFTTSCRYRVTTAIFTCKRIF